MPLNTIMYHYVRNNEDYEYDTFCRRLDEFYSQIEFLKNDSEIVDPEDIERVNFYLYSNSNYAYLLTFDDGYYDHLNCAKFLSANNLSAYFFPPQNIFENQILSVNLIHFILGNRNVSSDEILKIIIFFIKENNIKIRFNKKDLSIDNYLEVNKEFNTSNPNNINNLLIKRLLQRDIQSEMKRSDLINFLFEKIYNKNPKSYLKNFYLSIENMKEMKEMGMCFGSHGVNHQWMSETSLINQKEEIENSYQFLESKLRITSDKSRVFCYPYGDYNNQTLEFLIKAKVKLAFTTNLGESVIDPSVRFSKLLLKRWDTNNFWNNAYRKPCLLDRKNLSIYDEKLSILF